MPEFDYSKLGAEFAKLSKPAKRALLNNRIYGVHDLAARNLHEVAGFHGLGPASMPILKAALRKAGLAFAAE